MANEFSTYTKSTLVPLPYASWQLTIDRPYPIGNSITVENVSGLLKEDHFKVWKQYLSPQQVSQLASAKVGLLHRFVTSSYRGPEEPQSRDLLHDAFVCLRVIRPTRSDFSVVQFTTPERDILDVFSISQPFNTPTIVPTAQALSTMVEPDFHSLQALLPTFVNLLNYGPMHLRRAIRYFEAAYSDVHQPVMQILLWTMGIESVFSSSESRQLSREELLERVYAVLPPDTPIVEHDNGMELPVKPRQPVGAVLNDVFVMRNYFVHGGWLPDEWLERQVRCPIC